MICGPSEQLEWYLISRLSMAGVEPHFPALSMAVGIQAEMRLRVP